jgi:hypothetical protein
VQKKRDIVAEILEKRTRNLRRVPRFQEAHRRYGSIGQAYFFLRSFAAKQPKIQNELYRYIPISLVATLEGYFKRLVKELIDFGDPYRANATAFSKEVSIDLATAAHLAEREITFGELVAYQLPHSNRFQISTSLGRILAQDFEQELRKRLATEGGNIFSVQLPKLVDHIYKLRHVYCHEIAAVGRTKIKELEAAIKSCHVYTTILEEHVREHVRKASNQRSKLDSEPSL